MKHLIIVFAIFWMGIGNSSAQSDAAPKVSKKVIQIFQAEYKTTDLEEVSWDVEEGHFIAQFWDQDSEGMLTIHYDNDGKKTKIISDVNEDQLSKSILSYIEKNQSKSVILASRKIVSGAETQFSVEFESDKEYITILFSADAKVLEKDAQAKEVEDEEEYTDGDD